MDYRALIEENLALASRTSPELAISYYETILRLEESAPPEMVTQVRDMVAGAKPEIYRHIGEYHRAAGKLDLALQYLEKSCQLQPGLWQTHLALGRAYRDKGMDRHAVGECQEVLRLAPEESAEAYEILGQLFEAQGRPPHTVTVWFEHAAEYYEKAGRFDDARRVRARLAPESPPTPTTTSLDEWLNSRS